MMIQLSSATELKLVINIPLRSDHSYKNKPYIFLNILINIILNN